MTRVILIHAGPTSWDEENRIVGRYSLPLTPDGAGAARSVVDAIAETVTSIYLCRANEACEAVGKMLAARFSLRLRNAPGLEELNVGLWQGLTRDELHHRFPSVMGQWETEPLSVKPPEGESLPEAIERIEPALRKILRRNRGGVVALVLRPLALQIVAGLLRKESAEVIAAHLQNTDLIATIEGEW